MRCVVTGGAGFIGSALVRYLVSLDEISEVVVIDCLTNYYDIEIKKSNVESYIHTDKVRFVSTDINDISPGDLRQMVSSIDYIFHLAGQPGVRASWGTEFSQYVLRNISATQALLEASKDQETLKKFVFASSSSVYGEQPYYPVSEDAVPRPRSPYGVSKLAAENLVSLYAQNYAVPAASLRYFTVYGPGQRPDMAFSRFISWALKGRPIQIYGDGNQVREFTYVDDIVRANWLAAISVTSEAFVGNICGGHRIKLRDVIDLLQSQFHDKVEVQYSGAVLGDVVETGGLGDIARDQLGWVPSIDFEDGIRNQVDWIKKVGPLRLWGE